MSAVSPRPVGPTTERKASAAIVPSLPRRRTQPPPYQVISMDGDCPRKGENRERLPNRRSRFGGRERELEALGFAVPLTRTLAPAREATSPDMVKKATRLGAWRGHAVRATMLR